MKIKINYIEKTEGHLDFEGALLQGDVATAKILTTEGVRLIEAILQGRKFYQAPIINARICGVCPVVHILNTIKTIEDAFGFLPSKQTVKLRKLMNCAQQIHSHALHFYFLSAPDFYGISDDLKFIKKYPKEAKAAIRSRTFGLKILDIVGGRAVHPIAAEVGGFKKIPSKKQLLGLLELDFPRAVEDARTLLKFALQLNYPKFERKTEFFALSSLKEYAHYEGRIKSTASRSASAKKFGNNISELQLPGLGAKRSNFRGKSYMVGALARLNLNYSKLNLESKKILGNLKLKFPIYNTFYNVLAQAIEILHFTEESGKLLKDLAKTIKPEKSFSETLKLIALANPKNKTTIGYSVMEAPRGILYDMIEISREGIITRANIITPTVQFLNNLEEDLKLYIPDIKKLSKSQRLLKIKTLIRAYDPCIACATH